MTQKPFDINQEYVAVLSREHHWLYKIELHAIPPQPSMESLRHILRDLLTAGEGSVKLHALIVGGVVATERVKELVGSDLKHRIL